MKDIPLESIAAARAAGYGEDELRIVIDLTDHAANQALETITKIAQTAPNPEFAISVFYNAAILVQHHAKAIVNDLPITRKVHI